MARRSMTLTHSTASITLSHLDGVTPTTLLQSFPYVMVEASCDDNEAECNMLIRQTLPALSSCNMISKVAAISPEVVSRTANLYQFLKAAPMGIGSSGRDWFIPMMGERWVLPFQLCQVCNKAPGISELSHSSSFLTAAFFCLHTGASAFSSFVLSGNASDNDRIRVLVPVCQGGEDRMWNHSNIAGGRNHLGQSSAVLDKH